jgi:hypothetical protein
MIGRTDPTRYRYFASRGPRSEFSIQPLRFVARQRFRRVRSALALTLNNSASLVGDRWEASSGGSPGAVSSGLACPGRGSSRIRRSLAAVPELAAIIDTLAQLPEADRMAIADHVATLAGLSPARRAAILTLTRPE